MSKLQTYPTARHVKGKVIIKTKEGGHQITLEGEAAMKLAHELMDAGEKAEDYSDIQYLKKHRKDKLIPQLGRF